MKEFKNSDAEWARKKLSDMLEEIARTLQNVMLLNVLEELENRKKYEEMKRKEGKK